MSGIPWENEESLNYIRAHYIVTDAVRKELRDFFIQEWNKRYQASLGAWDDTNVSGSQLFNLEKKRTRPNKAMLQSKFQNGNTNEWDCTVLFDAILYSNSMGGSLSTTEKIEIENLRKIRNEIIWGVLERRLTDKKYQTMTTNVINALHALGLSSIEVVRIKNLHKSFKILPPAPTHEVVSRSDKIHEIREDLEKLRSDNDGKLTYFYISGNPGSGKSQLARQVCESFSSGIHWQGDSMFVMTLNGKDLDSLFDSYEEFCHRLNCNESAIKSVLNSSKPKVGKIEDLRSQISSRIKNWKKWWIIVDNVENLELISSLLPLIGDEAWSNGQVILTTQNRDSIPFDALSTKHISVSLGLNDKECRQLLALLSRTDVNDPLLDEVAEKLDRQPLALAAAAVYMRQVIEIYTDFSWWDYLQKLDKGERESTEERLQQTNSAAYSSTMTAAVLLAVKECSKNNIILEHSFNLFSLISFEALPLDLVVKYIQQQDEELDAEDIILAIRFCSLFVLVENKESDIRLHHVIHEAIRIFCSSKEAEIDNIFRTEISKKRRRKTQSHIRNVIHNVVKTMSYFNEREDKIKLIPHLKAFHKEIKNNSLYPDHMLYALCLDFEKAEACRIYQFFGKTLYLFSEYTLSMEFYQLALKVGIERFGPNHVSVATTYNNLGAVYSDKGELEKASFYYQHALKIQLKQLKPNHVDIATSYNNLGTVCSKKGNLEQAIEYYQCALKIQLKQLEPNQVDVATFYNNLGTVCRKKCDLERSCNYYKRALKIQLERLGPTHVDVVTSYNNLGAVCSDKGDLDQARDYHLRALEIRLKALGPNHAGLATSYNNLGTVCSMKGDLYQASEYYTRALKIQFKQLGPSHLDVATSYNNLANVCRRKGDLDEANDCYQRALKITLEQLGPNHTDVATLYNNLGVLCSDKGDIDRAFVYYQQALKIRLELSGQNHTDVATLYNNLGGLCSDKGDFDHAIVYYQQALKIKFEKLGPNHTDLATLYNNLRNVSMRKGDFDQANDYYQQALKITLEQLGTNNGGAACRDKGDLEQTSDYHQQALKIQSEQLEKIHTDVAISYKNLGNLRRQKGDLDQANDYYQRDLKIRLEQLGPNHTDVATLYNNLGVL
ncbi:uncharacterized protein LOC114525918 isoform X1 [Dendronephthya gigantea]|uniref:uncharacterized protein LOC114525918 isoform X1 n=1 Tax=Dendronephthya gigantea TaxID=151771 RepID=UPI001068D995|nr:uncharacterized protein LOC114525918 isoform X1 [Dendronephthya gigantea]